ncbi:MAG: hypothetical protein HC920_12650 [Oscillatoriales cyanobacterium SM2_3_0]|nr:hypothetical protein [Oscillatoriales cyanobacterium SM2_3_0]
MMNITTVFVARYNSLTKALTQVLTRVQTRWILGLILVGMTMMTALPMSVTAETSNPKMTKEVRGMVHDNDSQRPKTTGEWNAEARETDGKPLETVKRAVEDSAEAVGDWAGLYPDVAERTIPALEMMIGSTEDRFRVD